MRNTSDSANLNINRRQALFLAIASVLSVETLSAAPQVAKAEVPEGFKLLTDKKKRFSMICPVSFYESSRNDSLVCGDFKTTEIGSVIAKDANVEFAGMVQSVVKTTDPVLLQEIWGVGIVDDVVKLLMSSRDAAASLGGKQFSVANKVEVIRDGSQFRSDLPVVSIDFITKIETKGAEEVLVRKGKMIAAYKSPLLIIATYSAPETFFEQTQQDLLLDSFKISVVP